jgi:creatinine amidohydrolase
MTQFFQYDELTWPEIDALPRDTPLVLPLGRAYPLDSLTDLLGAPSQVGWLPAFPFGWPGSGLEVPQGSLEAVLTNLRSGLLEEGFSRVYFLAPAGASLELENTLKLPKFRPDNRSSWFPPDGDQGKVVLAPIGHTEQHGYHLPMSTDTLIIEAIGARVTNAVPDQVTLLPAMPYGVSTHRPSFAGTLNAGGRAFEDFWLGVIDTLVARGFDRMYLMSGHGGNCSFLVNVVKYAGEKHRRIFCATAWLYLSGAQGADVLQKLRKSPRGGMGHACELETSLILHLRPDLVHMHRAVDEMNFVSTPDYYMDWVEGGALVANPPWDDDTVTGAYGAGSLATAANGKAWLEAAIAEKIGHVAEIHTQHVLREARRNANYGEWGKIKDR